MKLKDFTKLHETLIETVQDLEKIIYVANKQILRLKEIIGGDDEEQSP